MIGAPKVTISGQTANVPLMPQVLIRLDGGRAFVLRAVAEDLDLAR